MKKLSLIAMLAILTLGVVACKPATSSSETPAPSQQPSSEVVSSEPEGTQLPVAWGEGATYSAYECNVSFIPGAIAKSKDEFTKWVKVYPFYANIEREGVELFGAA